MRLASAIVEHHLVDGTHEHFAIRPATIDDATEIARLTSCDIALSTDAKTAAEQIVKERLAIESGDDYFTIVATEPETGAILGWLGGGGCRGQEMKGWGELYAFATDAGEHTREVEAALVNVALLALKNAKFAGVTVHVCAHEVDRIACLVELGFVMDGPRASSPQADVYLVVDFVSD